MSFDESVKGQAFVFCAKTAVLVVLQFVFDEALHFEASLLGSKESWLLLQFPRFGHRIFEVLGFQSHDGADALTHSAEIEPASFLVQSFNFEFHVFDFTRKNYLSWVFRFVIQAQNRVANSGSKFAVDTAPYEEIWGAGDETRTRDINLGKVALYQLSYTRVLARRET